MNIISTKDFYGYYRYVVHFAAFQFEFYFIFIVNTVVFYNYCPTSPSGLLRKLSTSMKGNDWQIKMKYVLFLKILSSSCKHWQPSWSIESDFESDGMAWDSAIYMSKLLCGSINKHGMWTKNYFIA